MDAVVTPRDLSPTLLRAHTRSLRAQQMSQWLVDIREISYKMGGAAMRRYTKIQGASTESGAGLEGDGGGTRSQVSSVWFA